MVHVLDGQGADDLPIEQPTRFTLVINASAAEALGLSLSQSLLLRAEVAIECGAAD